MKNRWILPQRLWTVQMVETTMLVLSPSGTFSTDSLKSRCLLLHPGDNFIFAEPLDPDMAACVGALAPVSHHANQKYLPFVIHSQCLTACGTRAVCFGTTAKNSIGLSPRFSPACLRVGTQSTAPGVRS